MKNQIGTSAARRAQAAARRASRATFPRPEPPPWHGRQDLLTRARNTCPDCGARLHAAHSSDALALFWMHGFGAVVRTTFASCSCGYRRHWLTQTINPIRL